MSHEHEVPTGSAATAELPDAPEPAFLARARRILAGDVRPDDYLPVPDQVRAEVMAHIRQVEAEHGWTALPSAVLRVLNEWTLFHHHDGENVLAKYTDQGVLVLAAGSQQIYQVNRRFNPDHRSGFGLMSPSTAW